MLVLLLACSDYDLLGGAEAPPVASDSGQADPGSMTPPPERCNGVDDDADGAVDEGWADSDADGTADCIDAVCMPDAAVALPTESVSSCQRILPTPVALFAALRTEAIHADFPDIAPEDWHLPLLAPLTDTDGDGDVDIDDESWDVGRGASGELVAMDLEGGSLLWRTRGDDGMLGAALCDANVDGEIDVIAVQAAICDHCGKDAWALQSRDPRTGVIRWESENTWLLDHMWVDLQSPECVDINGDGLPEIVTPGGIFQGADGAQLAAFDEPPNPTLYWNVAVADVDLDGDQEVAMASTLRDSDGSVLWDLNLGARESWVMVVQGDDDADAELLMVTSRGLVMADTDGTRLAENAADFGEADYEWPARPCAADVDGDGRQDFVAARGGEIRAWDRDLVEIWSAPASYLVNGSPCMAWDVDDDGAYEILNNDGENFTVYDGRTGAVLFEDGGRYEEATVSGPLVADIDRDGSAEIVVTSMVSHGDPAIKVWGHPDGLLPQGPLSWPVEQYHATNIGPMGEVPSTPPHYWLDNGGLFRGYPAGEHPGADIVVEITDTCQSSTWPEIGTISVTGTVGNAGPKAAESVVLTASAADGAALGSVDIGTVASGTSVAFEVSFPLAPTCGGEVSITATTSTGQCDETNDQVALPEPDCSES